MHKFLFLGALLPFFFMLGSCSDDDADDVEVVLPANLTFESLSLYPEDFAYDEANARFFTGSAFTGDIISVDWPGNVTTLVDSDDLVATLGILYDDTNNEVVVLNGDPGFTDQGQTVTTGALAMVVRYNADSGAEIARYDLSNLILNSGHLLNDLDMDDAGNIYVTDSFSPAIYRITPAGVTSVFSTSPLFETAPGTFGLNGIAFAPGYLLVTHYQNQQLLKVSISDPTDITLVSVDQSIGSGDGIRFNDGNLLFVNNSIAGEAHTLFELSSDDMFDTATVSNSQSLGSGLNFPTTVEIVGGDPYVLSSYLLGLLGMPPSTDRLEFDINRVDF